MDPQMHTSRLKTLLIVSFLLFFLPGCKKGSDLPAKEAVRTEIEGSWRLIYAEIRERDSVSVKDMSNTDFIKIINQGHFAFFNQDRGTSDNFMAGGGSYSFDGVNYEETLDFISVPELRSHVFPFQVEFVGDTLIQQGQEKVEEAGLDRYILEKYIRIKN